MDYNITLIQPDTYNVKMDNVIKVEPPQESLVVKSTEEEQVIIPQDVLYNKVIVEKLELQTKEIEPSQSPQVVVADEGYDGLKQVNINAVTSEIDDNIKPENIKNGVEILGVDGTLEVPDFSDTTATANDVVEGKQFFNASGELTTGVYKDMLQARVDATNSCKYLFYEYTGTNLDFIKNLNTSNVRDMSYMFQKCGQLTSLDISNFDTRNVMNMIGMFGYCSKLTSVDLSSFDTSNVTNMNGMFSNCRALTNLDVSNFDTSKVTDISQMFDYCKALTNLDLSSFDTSNVKYMNYMFRECSSLTSVDLNNWNTSSLRSMNEMFTLCLSLTSVDLSNWNTSNLYNMEYTFNNCKALTSLDLSSFDTSNVQRMNYTFNGCQALTEILGTIDMINVSQCSSMFKNCKALTNVTLKNIKTTLQIGSGTSYGHLLTLDCLINTIKELWDYSSGTKTYTLTIGSANIEKIANTYVKLITPTEEQIAQDPNIVNKKPCEVCESTDEGAMTLTEYATSKRWAIA